MSAPQLPEAGLLAHFGEVKDFISFIASLLVGLVVWAWTRMEKSVDRCAEAIEAHAANNEESFDKVFDHLRKTDENLNRLLGEHEYCTKQVEHMTRSDHENH